MNQRTINVLLVEHDPVAAGLIHSQLHADFSNRFEIELADSLGAALRKLAAQAFDVVVMDLILPDGRGIECLESLRGRADHLPIVVLTELDDEELAATALKRGAQDYLIKGELGGRIIARSLRYAIERQRLTEALRGLSLIDDATGIYNRRGFRTLAEQHVRGARRQGRGVAMILAGLHKPGDNGGIYGREPASPVLRRMAEILRDTFRGSDLIARISGSGFAVLFAEPAVEGARVALARLRSNLRGEAAGAELVWLEQCEPDAISRLVILADRGLRQIRGEARRAVATSAPPAP